MYKMSSMFILSLLFFGCMENTSRKPHETGPIKKIFIIGDSTVHRHTTEYLLTHEGMTCGEDNPKNLNEGWGDELYQFSTRSDNVINLARQGSSSVSFMKPYADKSIGLNEKLGVGRDWPSTYKLMSEYPYGFLLIQFGSGNENNHTPKEDKDHNIIDYNHDGVGNEDDEKIRIALRKTRFEEALTFYIEQARSLNVTPILISVIERRIKDVNGKHKHTRGEFPTYTKKLAKKLNVGYLNLYAKSYKEFSKYSDKKLMEKFGDCRYENGIIDRVHLEPHGAKRVAKWIPALACNLTNKSLCNLLK